jgi:hypothetical protein
MNGYRLFRYVASSDLTATRRGSHFVVGCDRNRPTLDSIRKAGLTVTRVEHMTLPKVFKFVSPAIAGSATVLDRRAARRAGSGG